MAEKKEKVTKVNEETKVSIKDKIVDSKPIKWLKVNWKGLLIGFGTGAAAGVGAAAAYSHSQKVKEAQGDLDIYDLPEGGDPYLNPVTSDSTDNSEE